MLDLLLAMVVFLLVISLYEFTWRSAIITSGPQEEELSLRAYHVANSLFESGGYPDDWTPDTVRVIGICTERNVINRNKLVNLIDLINNNYTKAKELLGLGYEDIYMNVTDPNGNLVYIDGRAGSMGMPPTGAFNAAHTGNVMQISSIMRSNNSVAILFDQSGSMSDMLPEGRTKLAAAKLAFNNFLLSVLPGDEIGITTFRNCGDLYVAQTFTNDMNLVRGAVNAMSASGWTPLADSTEFTANFTNSSAHNENRVMIVFSDGEETCGGDPSAAAAYAIAKGVNKINTIGFVLTPSSQGAQELQAMALIGNGKYYSANNSVELQQALQEAYASSERQVVINIVIWR